MRTADNIAGTPSSSATVDITGTAGETISSGNCAYLSDGSGSKTAGQFYKCDSANPYSSTLLEVGIAPSAIAATASGTIRIAGSVTGLSSLSVGAEYFVGSTGAITTTAPANKRHLGHADSATSLVLTGNPALSPIAFVDDFRLSLTTATCITTSDVTAATTLYLALCNGNRITLFDSSSNPTTYTSAELSIAVPATTSQMYDVWVYASSGTPTLELLAWTNDTTRATALARTSGRWTKSGDPTRLYVGSVRTTTVSGQTEDSLTKRYVWNFYNRVPRALRRLETNASWNYTTLTWRQANASTSNQLAVIVGVAEVPITVTLRVPSSNSVGGAAVYSFVAVGENSTTTPHASCAITPSVNSGAGAFASGGASSHLDTFPAVGYSFYAWLEESTAGTGTTTYYGTNSGTSTAALSGSIPG